MSLTSREIQLRYDARQGSAGARQLLREYLLSAAQEPTLAAWMALPGGSAIDPPWRNPGGSLDTAGSPILPTWIAFELHSPCDATWWLKSHDHWYSARPERLQDIVDICMQSNLIVRTALAGALTDHVKQALAAGMHVAIDIKPELPAAEPSGDVVVNLRLNDRSIKTLRASLQFARATLALLARSRTEELERLGPGEESPLYCLSPEELDRLIARLCGQ
jgi:hypothetical protein